MIESVVSELKRSPIASISGLVAVLIAAVSLFLANSRYMPGVGVQSATGDLASQGQEEFVLANALLAIAFYIAASLSAAFATRMVARRFEFAALFLSVPLASLVNFMFIVVLFLSPPRSLGQELFSRAHDLVFYGTSSVFLMVCGLAVLRSIASPGTENKKDGSMSYDNAMGSLVWAIIVLLVWSSAVFKGQALLTETFLPSVTHPIQNSGGAAMPNQPLQPTAEGGG
ncbi:MAG: hypothetical protein R3E87_02730 [Burkholderiaceae bacterium]